MLVVLLYLQEHARPFDSTGKEGPAEKVRENDQLHLVESFSLLILIMMVWSAGFFGVSECGKHEFGCSALGVFVIASNVVYLCACAVVLARAFAKRNKKLKKKLTTKFSRVASLMRINSMRSKPTSGGMTEAERRTTAFHEKMFPTELTTGELKMENNPLAKGRSRSQFARSADWMEAAEVELTVRGKEEEKNVVEGVGVDSKLKL